MAPPNARARLCRRIQTAGNWRALRPGRLANRRIECGRARRLSPAPLLEGTTDDLPAAPPPLCRRISARTVGHRPRLGPDGLRVSTDVPRCRPGALHPGAAPAARRLDAIGNYSDERRQPY